MHALEHSSGVSLAGCCPVARAQRSDVNLPCTAQAVSEEELRYSLGLNGMTSGKGKVDLRESNVRPIEVFMCSVVRTAPLTPNPTSPHAPYIAAHTPSEFFMCSVMRTACLAAKHVNAPELQMRSQQICM